MYAETVIAALLLEEANTRRPAIKVDVAKRTKSAARRYPTRTRRAGKPLQHPRNLVRIEDVMLTSESLGPASLFRRGGGGLRDQLEGALVSNGVVRCRRE